MSFLVYTGIRVRDWPFPLGCAVLSLTFNELLHHYFVHLPAYVDNALVGARAASPARPTLLLTGRRPAAFLGTFLSCTYEYLTGKSHLLGVLPLIVLLAPGAGGLLTVRAAAAVVGWVLAGW